MYLLAGGLIAGSLWDMSRVLCESHRGCRGSLESRPDVSFLFPLETRQEGAGDSLLFTVGETDWGPIWLWCWGLCTFPASEIGAWWLMNAACHSCLPEGRAGGLSMEGPVWWRVARGLSELWGIPPWASCALDS